LLGLGPIKESLKDQNIYEVKVCDGVALQVLINGVALRTLLGFGNLFPLVGKYAN